MDIYFSEEYGRNYETKDDKLETFNFISKYGKVKYTFLKRKIDLEYFDITTPYGYGGPYFYETEKENLSKVFKLFREEFEEYCIKEKIVSEFISFNPIYDVSELCSPYLYIQLLKHTIYMDLECEEKIVKDMESKARNILRKALKNNLVFEEIDYLEGKKDFIRIYFQTMEKNNASSDYFFSEKYFDNLFNNLKDKVKLFYVKKEDEILCVTLILIGDNDIHYHLSGNTELGYKFGANSLLLYKIAVWGSEKGYKKFHLGGGYGGDDSSLFKFKKSLAKENILNHYIGKKIHNVEKYQELVLKKFGCEKEINLDLFFPLYRKN